MSCTVDQMAALNRDSIGESERLRFCTGQTRECFADHDAKQPFALKFDTVIGYNLETMWRWSSQSGTTYFWGAAGTTVRPDVSLRRETPSNFSVIHPTTCTFGAMCFQNFPQHAVHKNGIIEAPKNHGWTCLKCGLVNANARTTCATGGCPGVRPWILEICILPPDGGTKGWLFL